MNARFTSLSSARKMPTSAAASHCSKSKPSNMETNELKKTRFYIRLGGM